MDRHSRQVLPAATPWSLPTPSPPIPLRTPRGAPDGSGGAIIGFQHSRNGSSVDIYAQAVDGLGRPLWGDVGVPVCLASGDQAFATQTYGAMAPDGLGGCYVVWEDPRLPSNGYDVYMQHLTRTGGLAPHWPANGLRLTNQAGDQRQPSVVSDDAGGAIVVWQSEVSGEIHIYASRVIAGDTLLAMGWAANGNVVCDTAGNQVRPVLTKDGGGGAIFAWADDRGADIYAQHLLSDGSRDVRWVANGVRLTSINSAEINPEIAPDDTGGAIVVWTDNRTLATKPDVYAQHIVSSGVLAGGWPVDGLPISTAALDQSEPHSISDGSGGVITCWHDKRNGTDVDIYAQRVTAGGVALWDPDGRAVCTAGGNQQQLAVAPDAYGGAVMAWQDFRPSTMQVFASVFAQRIGHGGELGTTVSVGGRPAAGAVAMLASPNPAREATTIVVTGVHLAMNLIICDVEGRAVRNLAARSHMNGERQEVAWDLRDESGRRVSPGLYWIRARTSEGSTPARGALIVLH